MSLLVRKIEIAKWKPAETRKVKNVPGDAITGCLRTKSNALSVWQISFDEEEKTIEEGALALITGPEQKHIESIDIVLLNPKELRKLEITQEEGRTHVKDLVHSHRNISKLTYAKLGIISKIILKKLHKDQVKRKTKPALINIVIEALKLNRLKFNDLHENIQQEIKDQCERNKINIEDIVK